MPDRFITYPASQDPDDYAQLAYDYIRTVFPNWEPHDGQLDSVIIQAKALRLAVLGEMLGTVTMEGYRDFGRTVVGLPPGAATAAMGSTTWTFRNTDADVVSAGWQVALEDENGDLVLFEVVDDVAKPTGVSSIGNVLVAAQTEGTGANGLTGTIQLVEAIDRITNVTLQGSTAGGTDEEDIEDYVNRLSGRIGLMSPRPVLAADFALMARTEFTSIYRALAIDNFIPPSNFTAENAVGLAIVDEDGNDLAPTIGAAVDTYFQGLRPQNFVFSVVSPTYSPIAVTFTATAWSGYATSDVLTRARQAVIDFLSPADFGSMSPDQRDWVTETKVRYNDLVVVIKNVEGVRYLNTLTFAIQGNTLGTTDVTLPGSIPLPTPSTANINGTVT